jgi:RNA polymerase sigma-70 factor (ECF subfamily)
VTDTQDLVQDVLLQTFKKLSTFESRGNGALAAYLRQAVLNRLRDELRRVKRRPEAVLLDSRVGDHAPSPLELAVGAEGIERYERALASLGDDDRGAVIARLELGWSYQEVAEMLGKPSADAARKAVERAVVRLVQEMGSGV